ncbi:AMP-binding protein [Ornithinimicrobium ciconiae]|uniref:AMP-binding protein n=1 Tax=Ornithinimicrobium ciconiae TaxID=2594265 RepID=A0A516G7U1_9MICO|nr:AMP-binding protein [Ornithinimicrobium ciconiae]QDO87589.1 AMP-binding protein [Ornithinimicrobium ciconiae]
MVPVTTATTAYRTARDQLLDLAGDPERARAEFTYPDVGPVWNWAVDWFDAFARGNDRPGLIVVEEDGSDETLTFGQIATRSDQVATFLAQQGVTRGDSVIVMLDNQVELWDTMLGIMKIGAVIMPTTTAVGPADLRDRIERGDARAVVANAADTGKFEEVPGDYLQVSVGEASGWTDLRTAYALSVPEQGLEHPGTAPGDRLLLYFTSGTTNRPKLVEHTQASYPVGHLSTMAWLGVRPGDVHLNISSPGWAKHAWSCFFAPWIAEATIMVYNYARFDAAALLKVLRAYRVTSFCAPPTVWRMLINADLSGGPGALREVIGAGEPLNPEVIAQVQRQWGRTLRDGYGQTETTAQIGNMPGDPVKPGSMGKPLPGMPCVLVDVETGQVVQGAGEGELCLDLSAAPVALMTGYQGDQARNAEAMADGFYHTGDVAARDEKGMITYVGRTDDVFKASDYKISPFELESVLIEHPAVAEAAVVPAPDEVRLAVPKAYIALAPGHEPTRETAFAILKHAREQLAPWQRVRRIEFYELPKTISGKIRRVELRSREQELADEAAMPGTTGIIGQEYRDTDFPELRQPGGA